MSVIGAAKVFVPAAKTDTTRNVRLFHEMFFGLACHWAETISKMPAIAWRQHDNRKQNYAPQWTKYWWETDYTSDGESQLVRTRFSLHLSAIRTPSSLCSTHLQCAMCWKNQRQLNLIPSINGIPKVIRHPGLLFVGWCKVLDEKGTKSRLPNR